MQMSLSLEQNRQTRVTMVWPFTTFVFFFSKVARPQIIKMAKQRLV